MRGFLGEHLDLALGSEPFVSLVGYSIGIYAFAAIFIMLLIRIRGISHNHLLQNPNHPLFPIHHTTFLLILFHPNAKHLPHLLHPINNPHPLIYHINQHPLSPDTLISLTLHLLPHLLTYTLFHKLMQLRHTQGIISCIVKLLFRQVQWVLEVYVS
jgi:hypothetical protein